MGFGGFQLSYHVLKRCNLCYSSTFHIITVAIVENDLFLHPLKKQKMKLSKSLLGAIVIGIAVQTTVTSCKKDHSDPKPKEQKKEEPKNAFPDGCPACGMG